MKPEQVTESLEEAARQVGIRVRYETMTGETVGAGGLCKVRGDWVVIIDRRANPSDRAAILVDALAGFDLENVFLPPGVREALARRRADTAAERPAEAGPTDTATPIPAG